MTSGHDTIHVRDIGLATASDDAIFDAAAADDRIIVSADSDFGTLLALRSARAPSVILLRGAIPRRPVEICRLMTANFQAVEEDLRLGAVVIIEPGRIRVRRLPLTGPRTGT